MTDRPASSVDVASPEATGLEPDAIGMVQDTLIGMAASAPSASVGLTIAGLAAVSGRMVLYQASELGLMLLGASS